MRNPIFNTYTEVVKQRVTKTEPLWTGICLLDEIESNVIRYKQLYNRLKITTTLYKKHYGGIVGFFIPAKTTCEQNIPYVDSTYPMNETFDKRRDETNNNLKVLAEQELKDFK